MKKRSMLRRSIVLTALISMMVLVAPAVAGEVVIDASALEPTVLSAVIGERVTFVNHSGRPVHIEFGVDPERHHVFQVPGQMWAVFHRPGSHAYAVHPDGGPIREIRGVVDVTEDASVRPVPECSGFATVMGVCLEP